MTTRTRPQTREQAIDAMLSTDNRWNNLTAAFMLRYPKMIHLEARCRAALVIQGRAELPKEMR